MELTDTQLERYSRHIILEQIGPSGQEKLLVSKVLIIGAGGLGASAALYLAAAGIGVLGLVDADLVDMTNLQRQVIHHTPDIGNAKVLSAAEKIAAINPDVTVHTHNLFVRADNILDIIHPYDFIIDGTDNFATKFLINDACYFEHKPFSHAGILRFEGQLLTVVPGSACYRCLFDAPPPPSAAPSCSQAGVLGVLAGVIGSLQATEAIKCILGIGQLLSNSLLTYDALNMRFRKISVTRNAKCRLCGAAPTITALFDEDHLVCGSKNAARQK